MTTDRLLAGVRRRAVAVRLTVTELAGKAGVSSATLWRLENGKHKRPDSGVRIIRKLEEALDVIEASRRSTLSPPAPKAHTQEEAR